MQRDVSSTNLVYESSLCEAASRGDTAEIKNLLINLHPHLSQDTARLNLLTRLLILKPWLCYEDIKMDATNEVLLPIEPETSVEQDSFGLTDVAYGTLLSGLLAFGFYKCLPAVRTVFNN